jgi:hypothetical protein
MGRWQQQLFYPISGKMSSVFYFFMNVFLSKASFLHCRKKTAIRMLHTRVCRGNRVAAVPAFLTIPSIHFPCNEAKPRKKAGYAL